MLDWPELESACLSCQKCALAETRHNVVFGDGARNAEVMFIGEGPANRRTFRASRSWDARASFSTAIFLPSI